MSKNNEEINKKLKPNISVIYLGESEYKSKTTEFSAYFLLLLLYWSEKKLELFLNLISFIDLKDSSTSV